MNVIYEPRGKALEYSPLALNLFTGCSHRCQYCYCPAIRRMTLESWAENPHPRKDILKHLENDARKYAGDKRAILLSFMSDPYCTEEAAKYTRAALEILSRYKLVAQVLTKNPERALLDIDLFQKNKWKIGSTIIFSDDKSREEWEPGAPSISSRMEAMQEFKKSGVDTWLSIEPVIYPEQALEVIRLTREYIDYFKVGRWNHDKRANLIDWKCFLKDAKCALEGCDYYIKKDLAKYE